MNKTRHPAPQTSPPYVPAVSPAFRVPSHPLEVPATITPDDIARATSPSTQMALALGATGKHLYLGTVGDVERQRRRARNRRARAARRVHRQAARR